MPTGVYQRSTKEKDRLADMLRVIAKNKFNSVNKICKLCSKEYTVHGYREAESKFCSTMCYRKGREFGLVKNPPKRGIKSIKEFTCKECGNIDTIKQSQYNHYKNAGSFCSLKCMRKNKDWRKSLSNKFVGNIPASFYKDGANNRRVQIHNGSYLIGEKNMYFRSRWEANYALYLDFLKKNNSIRDWSFEKDVFVFEKIKFGTRSYRPDFKIINNDGSFEYHEVKGYMDKKSLTKLKRMRIYYPEIKVVLIDEPVYKSLLQYKRLLKFYE